MAEGSSRVFVGGFKSSSISEDDLLKRFQVYGPVVDISATSRGFCFVQFENAANAQAAVDNESENFYHNNKKLTVQLAKSSAPKKVEPQEPTQSVPPWAQEVDPSQQGNNSYDQTYQPQGNFDRGRDSDWNSEPAQRYRTEEDWNSESAKRRRLEKMKRLPRDVRDKSRVFIRGPAKVKYLSTADSIRKLFSPFGEILDVHGAEKGYSFIQFSSIEDAAAAVNDRTIKNHNGLTLVVEVANPSDSGPKRAASPQTGNRYRNDDDDGRSRARSDPRRGRSPPQRSPPRADPWDSGPKRFKPDNQDARRPIAPQVPEPASDVNDCEIVVADSSLKDYAEIIESKLKDKRLQVDLLFPHPSVSINDILDDLHGRGVRYGIVVESSYNETQKTVNLCLLRQDKKYFRNTPVEEVISKIAADFSFSRPSAIAKSTINASSHPEEVQMIISFLVENRNISVAEYDVFLEYITQKRDELAKRTTAPRRTDHLLKGPDVDVAPLPFKNELGVADTGSSRQAALESRIKSMLTSGPASSTGKPNILDAQKSFVENYLKNRDAAGRY